MPRVWVSQAAHITTPAARDKASLVCSTETNRAHDDPQQYIEDAQYMILFLEKHLLVSSEAFSPGLSELINARKTALYRHIVESTLQHILIPATPATISDVPSWLELCQLGQTIMTNTLNAGAPYAEGYRILKDIDTIAKFADSQAGETYTERRVEAALDGVKQLVLGGWGGWDAMEVQKEREEVRVVLVEEEVVEDAAQMPQPMEGVTQPEEVTALEEPEGWGFGDLSAEPSTSPKATQTASQTRDLAEPDEAGDGWGFDDEAIETAVSPSKPTPQSEKASIDTSGDAELDGGWDFDLASLSPTASTAPASVSAPSAPPKPKAREAKKLGKKIGQKKARLAAQEGDFSSSEDVDMASSIHSDRSGAGSSSTAGAESKPVDPSPLQADGWGWEDDEPSSAVPVGETKAKSTTIPPPLQSSASITPPKRYHTVVKEQKITFTDTYLVSKSCQALVDLVKRCLDEANALHTSHADLNLPSQFAENAYRLITAASSVSTLFRALIFASPHVSDVPTLGMQLSNDCTWIAEHLPSTPTATPTADLPVWDREAAVSLMRSASMHAYEVQLATQREGVMRILDEMPDFVGIGEDANHKAAMKGVEELKGTIDSLGHVWKLVLPRPQYLAALGHLVDVTLSNLITSVLALDDIPQIESDHLVEILTQLKHIESMGIFDSQPEAHAEQSGDSMPVSSIATHVPHWLKFVYLIELLGASLMDIGQLLDHGALVDFEKEELVRLIRALFAESEVRENVVSRIEAAS